LRGDPPDGEHNIWLLAFQLLVFRLFGFRLLALWLESEKLKAKSQIEGGSPPVGPDPDPPSPPVSSIFVLWQLDGCPKDSAPMRFGDQVGPIRWEVIRTRIHPTLWTPHARIVDLGECIESNDFLMTKHTGYALFDTLPFSRASLPFRTLLDAIAFCCVVPFVILSTCRLRVCYAVLVPRVCPVRRRRFLPFYYFVQCLLLNCSSCLLYCVFAGCIAVGLLMCAAHLPYCPLAVCVFYIGSWIPRQSVLAFMCRTVACCFV